jgi:hypothetical protein
MYARPECQRLGTAAFLHSDSIFERTEADREAITMFVETVTAPGEVWHHWTDRLRLFTDPPVALFASIAWEGCDRGRLVTRSRLSPEVV